MTVKQIIEAIEPHRKISRETVYVHLRRLRIKPLGVRQNPQNYPDNTPEKILKRLGIANGRTLKVRVHVGGKRNGR